MDDQPLQRTGLRMILESEPDMEVVGEAGDGEAAVRQVAALRPDVVLMDVRMPGTDGIEATDKIIEGYPDVRVLILTMFDLDEYAHPALLAGASGFLLKDTRPEELLAGVRAVLSGGAIVAPALTRRLLDIVTPQLSRGAAGSGAGDEVQRKLDLLTGREREVLVELANGRSNAEIGERLHMAEATVKTHISKLMPKLSLRSRVQAVIFAYDAKIVTPGR
ncbi:response regulator transcription factor [Nocardiopsis exhalans]|uniref:response regulator transcription factor n=1 Tax=Nocardiopsis exhalans TaxID=163604 RepID=UPI00263B2E07|nr:response regulator transcription factor [Nocardiopsis exhalans]